MVLINNLYLLGKHDFNASLEQEKTMINTIFGRINNDGNVDVFFIESEEAVTRLDDSIATVYPIGSDFDAKYEHTAGITLTKSDAASIGLGIEFAFSAGSSFKFKGLS